MAQQIDWQTRYLNTEDPEIAGSLSEAQSEGLKFYRNPCPKHGPTVYRTMDNTCPYCVRENASKRLKENRTFNRSRQLLLECKRRARLMGRDFELDASFVRDNTPKVCPILRVPIESISQTEKDFSPSLDRLDSDLGYTRSNTRVISFRANRIKNNGTAREHMLIAIWQLEQSGKTAEEIGIEFQHLLQTRSETVDNG